MPSPRQRQTAKDRAISRSVSPVRESTKQAEHEYEFGGPVGAAFVMLTLPVFVVLVNTALLSPKLLEVHKHLPALEDLIEPNSVFVMFSWFGFQALLERLLPCEVGHGLPLKDGTRLPYHLNGHLAFWLTILLVLVGFPSEDSGSLRLGSAPLSWLADNYMRLLGSTIVFSLASSFALYVASFRQGTVLAEGGNSGNMVYDFFIGRELNPRCFGFDFKYFCELRPGLIGWVLLNMGMLSKQMQLRGGAPSWPMVLVNVFQGIYTWDALFYEQSVLSTMDITTDGFGYMLCFGDLVFVPFTFGLQARYLVNVPASEDPPVWYLALVSAVFVLGYSIFRGANLTKDRFRRNKTSPQVAHLKTLKTKRGTELIVSGWWGMARRINYTGDLTMALSWCLLTGFSSPVPYFYFAYLFTLLCHRAMRDDAACSAKYGDDWNTYKKMVPALFIPGVV